MFPEGRLLDLVIVGALALMVVGPKDLPILMRKLGAFVAKMRGMAAEFRASFDELARQSELDELRKEVEAMRRATPLGAATAAISGGETQAVFDDIHASLRGGDVQFPPPAGTLPSAAEPSENVEPPAAEIAARPDSPPKTPRRPASVKAKPTGGPARTRKAKAGAN